MGERESMDIHRTLTIGFYDSRPRFSSWTDKQRLVIRDVQRRLMLAKADVEFMERWLEAVDVEKR